MWKIGFGPTLLYRNHKDTESNGNPAKISSDKLVNFIKLFINIFSQLLPRQRCQKCLLAFLTLNRIWIPQVHRIIAVALHLRVFQGIVIFLREALWIKSIGESNDKLYQRYQPTNLVGGKPDIIDKIMANDVRLTQETLILREVSSWEDNERERLLKHF